MPAAVAKVLPWQTAHMQPTDLHWTTTLAYGRYTHATDVCRTEQEEDPLVWARANLQGPFRIYSDWTASGRSSVRFYTEAADQSLLLQHFGHRVGTVRRPFNTEAEQQLKQGMNLSVREHLFYHRYRFSMNLHCATGTRQQLSDWVTDHLGSDVRRLRLIRGNYRPILYLRDHTDVTLVRLYEPAVIVSLTRAWTWAEIHKSQP